MGLGKTYSTKYLADSNNSTGAAGQVLISTSTGINWSDANTIGNGPYLPLAGGTMTGNIKGGNSVKLLLGSGDVFQLYNDGNGFLRNYAGNLYIDQNTDNGLITFRNDNGSGGIGNYFTLDGNTTHAYFLNPGNVGIGTTSPVETLSVPSTKGVMLGFKRFYSGSGTIPAGIGASYTLTANLNEEQGTTLTTQHQYKFYLTTTGTGTYNSSVYIVYRNSADTTWDIHRVSSTGLSSNHPELTISGNNALIYNDHPNAYGVYYRVETSYTGQAKTSPEIFGSDYMWTRDFNNLHYTDGNVGIGTTDPGYKLDVNGNIRGTGVSQLNHLDCSSTLSFGSHTPGVQGTQFEGYSTHSVVRTDSARLDFYMGKTTTGVGTMMSLTDTGRVGIGTTDPQHKLHVIGDVLTTEQITSNKNVYGAWNVIAGDSLQSSGIKIGWDTIEQVSSDVDDASVTFNYNGYQGGTSRFRSFGLFNGKNGLIMEAVGSTGNVNMTGELNVVQDLTVQGNVGIGTTDPGEKLEVSGNVKATNFILSSDASLKEDINKLNVKVDAKWKSYKFKYEDEVRYGVIAQELEETNPELVKTDDKGLKSVKYIDLLIAKIAELEARLEELEK